MQIECLVYSKFYANSSGLSLASSNMGGSGHWYIRQDSVQTNSQVLRAYSQCQAERFATERQRWLVPSAVVPLSQGTGRGGLVLKGCLRVPYCSA